MVAGWRVYQCVQPPLMGVTGHNINLNAMLFPQQLDG